MSNSVHVGTVDTSRGVPGRESPFDVLQTRPGRLVGLDVLRPFGPESPHCRPVGDNTALLPMDESRGFPGLFR